MLTSSSVYFHFATKGSLVNKWNVTPLLLGGSNFYFFTDLYCARVGLNARFALPTKEVGKERVICKEIKSVFGKFSSRKTFSKIMALIVKEGRIRLEVDKETY